MKRDSPLTPMMRQYQDLKARHPRALLMFRLGDFYELFFEDAKVASSELEIVLTSREIGKGRRVPMCGVPHHALSGYLARLVDRGYSVAICDQVEDAGKARGLVRREVTRVVTPGTVMDAGALPAREHRYLAAAVEGEGEWGIAAVDLSTGEFMATQIGGDGSDRRAVDELSRIDPRELIVPETERGANEVANGSSGQQGWALTPLEAWRFEPAVARRALIEHFRVASLDGFGCEELPQATAAAGALVQYLQITQPGAAGHVKGLRLYSTDQYLAMDEITRRNLDLLTDRRVGTARSLLTTLDETVTPMGGRMMREWLLRPLVQVAPIVARQRAVGVALSDRPGRAEARAVLRALPDLSRIVGRIGHRSATPRDLAALRLGLDRLPKLREVTSGLPDDLLRRLSEEVDPHREIAGELARAIVDDPPPGLREGGIIRPGYDPELDRLRTGAAEGKAWIARLEAAERERTGIRSLRVGFNRVFGYYIEVSNANRHLVPANYIRRQTLVGAERYITPEMKEREAAILGAEERMAEVEQELFGRLRDSVAESSQSLLATGSALAEIDALLGFAEAAEAGGFVCPEVVEEPVLEIRAGRHPIVELALQGERFVPNDLMLDTGNRALLIVTGPNMAGKSTLLRQAALITVMAQMGSYVPAAEARIGVADRIFTRVGAADDISAGRSTFLVEMQEVARIVHGATKRSLIVLDEVGRGTSTYDGMSLAWAVVEYLHGRVGARTLFATHFHELTELAELLPRVHNVSMRVKEEGRRVVFLHEVAEGRADRSYGIHVARLAGLPEEITCEAERVLGQLEAASTRPREQGTPPVPSRARGPRQLPLLLEIQSPLEEALLALSVESMTPLDALQALAELRERARALRAAPKPQRDRRLQ